MRLANDSMRLMASVLVIGLLAAGLTLACAQGVHPPFAGGANGKCVIMSHSARVVAAAGSEAGRTLASQAAALVAVFVLFVFWTRAPRPVPANAEPTRPSDPLHGRLRI